MSKLTNLKREADNIRLSQQEKASMRARIFERIGASERAQAARRPVRSNWFISIRYATSFALVLMVLIGSTTAYAAQGSLPGGALYPVKIYVNESVQGALAFSPEAKASFHTNVAQERLKEAEALASQGKLDATVAASLEQSVDAHVAQANTIAQSLEEKDPAGAVDAQVTLDSSLAAHSAILEKIGNESKDENTKENSNSFAIKVRTRGTLAIADTVSLKAAAPSLEMQTMALSMPAPDASAGEATGSSANNTEGNTRAMTKASVTASSAPATSSVSQKKVAMQLQKKAASQLNDTHDDYSGAKRSLEATTSAKISAQLSALDKRMSQGKKQFNNKDYDTARATFTSVIKDSVELSATIEASKKYKQDFVRSWWKGSGEDSSDTHDGEVKGQQEESVSSSPSNKGSEIKGEIKIQPDLKKEDEGSSSLKVEVHL